MDFEATYNNQGWLVVGKLNTVLGDVPQNVNFAIKAPLPRGVRASTRICARPVRARLERKSSVHIDEMIEYFSRIVVITRDRPVEGIRSLLQSLDVLDQLFG